ncbi:MULTISPECIES: barstar family protein [Sphingobacterium]|uniref:Barstar (Barnase inhibitor) n=1 Tax=Sphingobacterium multivorum TaxID=28454 RepID=A0A654DMY7_SPHMU|nr:MULTISPECIES: barstar family protein [Sphingobacterium]VXD07110.1 Barstar (Barnase inhibitor) [Sphingobacterium multivorum]
MKKIKFLEYPIVYFNEVEYVAYLPKVEGENELFRKLSNILTFPDYFGENWSAVFDCLRDFSWISKKGITLVYEEIPVLSEEQLRIYFDVLFCAVNDCSYPAAIRLKPLGKPRSQQRGRD